MEKQQPIDPAFVRHTLLAGSGLPQRWQGRQRFVIVDTDFGVGLNFLTVWQSWQADPQRCRRLHVVAAARQPASRDELAGQQAAWPELAEQAGELQANWPPATSGMHRLHLAAGQVILTLIFGEAADPWRAVDAATDAFFLGTDSPAALPERCRALARLAAPGATLAAPQASEPLAAALRAAEFEPETRPAQAGHGDSLIACFRSRRPDRHPPPAERRAIVIGAGIAGSTSAHALAAAGWHVTVLEQAGEPALPATSPACCARCPRPTTTACRA